MMEVAEAREGTSHTTNDKRRGVKSKACDEKEEGRSRQRDIGERMDDKSSSWTSLAVGRPR